jgi:hypothetical protein
MANSTSDNLKLTVQATGENSGTWGQITNTNLLILEQAIGGYSAVAVNATTGATLTFSNGGLSDGKNQVIKLTGTITGNIDVVIPDSVEKTYVIENGTTGAFTVTVKTTSGTGVTWGTTDKGTKMVYSDGTNVVDTAFTDLSSDITPQLSANLDTNGNNILVDDTKGILDDSSNEQLIFSKTASAVNNIQIKNAATSSAPEISAIGDDSNIDLTITPKGDGNVVLDGLKYPNADGSADQLLKTDGSGNLSFVDAAGGTSWQSAIKTADFTAVAGEGYWVNTASGDVVVTLPGSASVGDIIELADYSRSWGTHSVTLADNGLNFQGTGSSVPVYNENGQHVILIYSGASQGWIPKLDSVVADKTQTILRFLNVAGGASGGANSGGGGGAGGLKQGTAVVTAGDVYTITIGGGGAGVASNAAGNNGTGSSIRASSGGKIISVTTGGGGGGGYNSPSAIPAKDGGCGGGSSSPSASPNGLGTAGEGFDGAPGGTGGGGGTGEAGFGAPSKNGGDGLLVGITGTATNFGGGGGGAPGDGGAGGGTDGVLPSGNSASSPANTGGGSGGVDGGGASGNGGSGVVFLRVRTAAYPGTTTGSPTVTTDGEDTIIKFTGSGTYTA